MLKVEEYIAMAKEQGASDIHLVSGLPPKCRIDGSLSDLGPDRLTPEDCQRFAEELAGERFLELMENGETDLSRTISGTRVRIHLFKQQGIPSAAVRLLRDRIPDLSELGLPPAVLELTKLKKGIVLVTGETGSGKSTTLAAILDQINHTRNEHIVTLEDPVEYLHLPDRCVFNQREVGRDTKSFASGVRASLREDPDVILIGELRDTETMESAVTAAETGHLVFATLHSGSAPEAVDRIVQAFPDSRQGEIRMGLSMTLSAVLSQALLPKKGGGRVLACEYMPVTDAVRNHIRTGNTPQIANAVATSAAIGGCSMDQSLIRLLKNRQITRDTALSRARDQAYVKKNAV